MAAAVRERLDVLRRHRLLEPERIVGLDPAGEADGAGWRHLAVRPHENVGLRANLGPDRRDHGFGGLQGTRGELKGNELAEGLILADGQREGIKLDRREAELDVVASPLGCIAGIEPQAAQALLEARITLVAYR